MQTRVMDADQSDGCRPECWMQTLLWKLSLHIVLRILKTRRKGLKYFGEKFPKADF